MDIRSFTNLPSVITHAQVKASLTRSNWLIVRVMLVKTLKIDGLIGVVLQKSKEILLHRKRKLTQLF